MKLSNPNREDGMKIRVTPRAVILRTSEEGDTQNQLEPVRCRWNCTTLKSPCRTKHPRGDTMHENDWRPTCPCCGRKALNNIRMRVDGIIHCQSCKKYLTLGNSPEVVRDAANKTSCDILRIPGKQSRTGLHIDHCHETGKIRGTIHSTLNTAEGQIRKASKLSGLTMREVCEKLLEYLGE